LNSFSRYPRWLCSALNIGHRSLRLIWRLLQDAYVILLATPVLLVRRTISLPAQFFPAHGSVLILCDRSAVKVASSRQSTILLEYTNARRMACAGTEIASCVPSFLLPRHMFFRCLISERYHLVASPSLLDYAVEVRRKLDSAGLKVRGITLDRSPQMQAGLSEIANRFGLVLATKMKTLAQAYLRTGNYHTGLCHGDFHSRNIMLDRNGGVRVIDLDCVRFDGIVEFDALYFALELEWSTSGALWLDTLVTAFKVGGANIEHCLTRFSVRWTDAMGLAFFLDRVGQESLNYGYKYSKAVLQPVVSAIQREDFQTID